MELVVRARARASTLTRIRIRSQNPNCSRLPSSNDDCCPSVNPLQNQSRLTIQCPEAGGQEAGQDVEDLGRWHLAVHYIELFLLALQDE